ncbi:SDR family oxidoreductase [Aromatoleum diolicum]|uniref:SDR family oxidoreductase n=1 Tax=Aromatoleum diolicum TaxID=75796 RepID=A0ABX1Q7H3_9RHOO|nr:SDR family oxidoreductase [Aromatoleum diolicum]NMG74314.1 SDR family oxidoreductase [Aromatoleum diolicum]
MKAIVTGHTRGLGAAIAEELLARKIPVLGLARTPNAALARRYPHGLEQVEVDLADSASLAQWLLGNDLHRFLSACPSVLLINNAGTLQPVGPIETQAPAAIARAVALNVAAPMMLAAAVAATSADAHDRRILHISSGAARTPYPGWSVYGATKAALDHHVRAVALDHSPALRICSLAPGVIDTAMQAEIRATPETLFPLRARFDALKRDGALAAPEDCARRLVDYLTSDRFGETPLADLRELSS